MRKVLYILGELEDSDLQWLLDAGGLKKISTRTSIIKEGTRNENLFIVVDGEFSVSKNGLELARLGAGEVLGDMSLLDSRTPSATVTALQESTVFSIPQRSLQAKLARDAQFAARFYRALCIFLANRLTRTDAMIGATANAGGRRGDSREELEANADEISPDALGNVSLAGARFNWFLQEVRRR